MTRVVRTVQRLHMLRLFFGGAFFLAVMFLVPSSSRANDFVRIGSPFASPVNLYGIATVYDRVPSTYEAWAVGEEVGTSKGVLLYFNGTFWSNITLEAGTPGLTSVSGQRYLTNQDACYDPYSGTGVDKWQWKTTAWAVGKGGTILKLDPYTNAWNAEKKVNVPVCSGGSNNGILCDIAASISACYNGYGSCSPATRGCTAAELKKPPVCVGGSNPGTACTIGGNECTGGGTCTKICENWTSIDFNAVAAAHETKAIAVGTGTGSGSTRPLFTYSETLNKDNAAATTCANKQLRQHAWSETTDTDFANTDDVRAAYYIDKDHAWLAGAGGKVWKYSQQNRYEIVSNANFSGQTFTSVAATYHPTITAGQPLKSLVWLGSEGNTIFRYDEATGNVSSPFSTNAPIRSLAISRRAGGRGAELVTNPSFVADRLDGGGRHYADGWQSSGEYINARTNRGYTSFLDGNAYYIGEPWQNIADVKNETLGNGLYVTAAPACGGLNHSLFPWDYCSKPSLPGTYATLLNEDLTQNILQKSGLTSLTSSDPPPYEIGTIITGFLKIPNNDFAKTYEFRIGDPNATPPTASPAGRISFNIENDSNECAGVPGCVDRTSFPAITSIPSTTNSAIHWTPGTCINKLASSQFEASCFDDSECYWGTCSNDQTKRCTNVSDCEGALATCDLWSTDTSGGTNPLCQGASSKGTVELIGLTNAVTFPANGGIKTKECTNTSYLNVSCTSDAQCGNDSGACQVRGGGTFGGWYPFAIQYYQPWTARCSNDGYRSCVDDEDCSGGFCQIGEWCVGGSNANEACSDDFECDSSSCKYDPNFPQSAYTSSNGTSPKYNGTCTGGGNAGKACRQSSDCGGGSCALTTDPPSPLKFQYREPPSSTWTDVPTSNLLSPSPNLPQSQVRQEIPLSLLPGTAYKISGKYRVEFTDQFDLYSPADPRWNQRPHAGVMTRCKNSVTGGSCGYEMNLFQMDRVRGVPNGGCKSDGSSCTTNQQCVSKGGICEGGWTDFSAVVTKRNYDSFGNPLVRGAPVANDAGQTLEVVCFADVGAKIACDDISVKPENEAAVPEFNIIDVWAVGDKDSNNDAVVYRNTIDVEGGVFSDKWFPQKSPVKVSLRSIATADPFHFWAVGEAPSGGKSTILRLSPANVTGWAWIGSSTSEAISDPIGWIDFNCGNQGTCASQPSSFGVNVNDSDTYGQCANNLAKSCKVPGDCGSGVDCVKGVISGSAWLGSQDSAETVDYGPCTSPTLGKCAKGTCSQNSSIECATNAICGGGTNSCQFASCSSTAQCSGANNVCEFEDSCDSFGQCSLNSSRLCSNSRSLCYGVCDKNQGFRCKTDSNCKIKCSDNPLACRSSGWLSFDKDVAGTPPQPPFNGANQSYIARFDLGTDAIDGWARLQFGKCVDSTNTALNGLACFQDSDCAQSGTCDYSNAPSMSRFGVTDAEAGWVKLRSGTFKANIEGEFFACKDCSGGSANNQSCKICTDANSTSATPACNDCSGCTAKWCEGASTPEPCLSNNDCTGAGTGVCKTAGQCSGTTSTLCFSDVDCGGTSGSCTGFGGFCTRCKACSTYGVSVDLGGTKQFSGFGWSPDLGWIDFGTLRLGGQLFFQTKYGDIYSGENIGSPTTGAPPGFPGGSPECNATYRLIAKGEITNFCSSAPITTSGSSAFLEPKAQLFPLPKAENRYTSQIGTIDVDGLTTDVDPSPTLARNKFGDVLVAPAAGNRTLRDFFPPPLPNDYDAPLLGKVYHVKGNLTVDENLTFDPPADETPQKSGAGTFVVEGNLIINANLFYLPRRDAGIKEFRQLPSLAFIVKGSITIDAAVSQLVGTYFTENTITVESAPSGDNQLVVLGAMIANQFDFKRKYIGSTGALEPAEKIIYDGRLQANAPPGLSALADGLPNIREVIP